MAANLIIRATINSPKSVPVHKPKFALGNAMREREAKDLHQDPSIVFVVHSR
eukprot:CAMPEP_0172626710 /NCGR_PEP_ID=MMETSP1068-20121228/152028_1 /TAXON_ID=35684 /ORGANISM="Pseudopedinella elastica, Strain CCMP716" /LENGTH=51 /DNA_ID=CAMNT_0013436413 /DNA_START=11 /DNA_END=162 /DNA_ORIENTATION=+